MIARLAIRSLLPAIIPLFIMTAQTPSATAQDVADRFDKVKVRDVISRRFTQQEMYGWLTPIVQAGTVRITSAGTSAEGRTINLYRYGTGPVKVLLWSQMHGDESTATMALLDIMSFLRAEPGHPISRAVRDRLTVLMLPMINPDGAERFTRRTAQAIDMNRDAMRFTTPEARVLKSVHDAERPDFGFNLHDQDTRYTVGTTRQITAIALLAPATDETRADNAVRLRAKRVAAGVATVLGRFIPGKVAKWDDTFEPRAFGDNMQRWETSTVLIESGGWAGDPEKMHLRKMNFVALLFALHEIATGSYERNDPAPYEALPFNMRLAFDVIIRNAKLQTSPGIPAAIVDVGINVTPGTDSTEVVASVEDIGDLSTYTAYKVYDAAGAELDARLVILENKLTAEQLRSLLPQN